MVLFECVIGIALLCPTSDDSVGDYWAFRPLSGSRSPALADQVWCQTPVDHFVLAQLRATKLAPAPRASRHTLIRRVTYNLIGLLPTELEIGEFISDESPDAYARLVDRLLASPRYGEKWGRHWLDVARYANSSGVDEDYRHPYAWRYRDYVIAAFNTDLPYDRFVAEQIAGDVLAERDGYDPSKIIATGFLALGPKALAQQDKVQMVYDVIDEQIDTMSKAFLGLTLACARCHDHKFDPITTRDYYSLASVFASTKTYARTDGLVSSFHEATLASPEQIAAFRRFREKVESIQRQVQSLALPEVVSYQNRRLLPRLADYMVAARAVQLGQLNAEEVAQRENLDRQRLDRWVGYLRPIERKDGRQEQREEDRDDDEEGDERSHLASFINANDDSAGVEASRLQRESIEKGRDLKERLIQWRSEVQAAVRTSQQPPKLPRRELFQGRFHFEVSIDEEGPFAISDDNWDEVLPEGIWRQIEQLQAAAEDLEQDAPPEPDSFAAAVAEGQPVEQAVFLRGNHHRRGEVVSKQFPTVLAGESQLPVARGSGRVELARWLTQQASQLTSRVMANRVWHWHFGRGIVRTPDNFGHVGEKPTHPLLLDYLASELQRSGWSVKHLHRLMLLSSTYQMSSVTREEAWQRDADNRMWSRFNRRRLTAEEIRDSLLQLSGDLDLAMGGTLQPELGSSRASSNSESPPYLAPEATKRRTVYVPLYRNRLPRSLGLFDFVDSTASTGRRSATNIPLQGLFFLNGEFVDRCAAGMARGLVASPTTQAAAGRAHFMCYGREPTQEELDLALSFIDRYPDVQYVAALEGYCRVLISSNELMYID